MPSMVMAWPDTYGAAVTAVGSPSFSTA
jgi:hypothetical protein